ncbi:class I SAM-dependent methyltransferase [Dasania sp. GY-MA-18]|uniref:Class I SAM-dependent methyltransferase n=1 Tax=Dasania phycosphaerae TaxID=2950436 RepID=A0A9J6RIF5_9GAMM|nr:MULTISPECIES: class I SAM-dependent methyltransferase [Dasania]MCR8922034.1 class I SAM-dependent methyltransferase [Dasania sp. GY-MA-18]MCZ0864462.1 class I SAM-dependent methyltransferase [Dasania phycosphaerae]MCZ0868190.1 class I SAM-dependent methyltransferase [Dasania phycosphaerae]
MTLAFSQSCENNKDPILAVLKPLFANTKRVLEIGSGTGQHAVYFAAAMPQLQWQPSDRSDYDEDLEQRCAQSQLSNLLTPIHFDVAQHWLLDPVDAIFTANTLHIMSWDEVQRFFAGVAELLENNGLVCVYGPFNYHGDYTSASNAQFDQWLQSRDPLSGIRDFEKVDALAQQAGLQLLADHEMPANNRCLVWKKA